MQTTIKAVEKAMIEEIERLAIEAVEKEMVEEVKRLAMQEIVRNNVKSASAVDETEELKCKAVQEEGTVKEVVEEMERLAMEDVVSADIKPASEVDEIEELKSKGKSIQEEGTVKEEMEIDDGLTVQKSKPLNGITMKDIPLDQVSDRTFYGRSRRAKGGAEDQMLQLWETAEHDCRKDVPVHETENQASAPTEPVTTSCRYGGTKPRISDCLSEEQVEKELGIDKLEVAFNRLPAKEGYKGKLLERLASDAQKLTTLQRTVQDLKKKMESNKRSKKTNSTEYETIKRQLCEVEEAVMQLVDINDQLTKGVEGNPSSLDDKTSGEIDEVEDVRRSRVTEQARKGSEKIGRLQFELQNIHYVLLKMEDENKNKGKSRFSESRTGVLLRDFIYSGGRSRQRRRKACLCACKRPLTHED